MPCLAHFLEQKYPGDKLRAIFRSEVLRVCSAFQASGMADPKFESELTSGSDPKFWSSLSEALIYEKLKNYQFLPRTNIGVGPDFLVSEGGRRIWIEVVCPEPTGLPEDWLEIKLGRVGTTPHNEILLRWTSAYKEKAEKLLGSSNGRTKGYLCSGIVACNDVYVIAINGCQLRHGPFSQLHGISQFPYAAEAVLPIGPYQVRIDRGTLEAVGSGHQERPFIPKPNGASVSTHAFLDPNHRMISAVWAVDFNCCGAIRNHEPSAIVHNPCAINPLTPGFLPADEEFHAISTGDD